MTTPMDKQPETNDRHEPDEIPQAVTDEELFAAYLRARLQQALETLNSARDDLAAQPNDFNRAVVVMRRVQELRDLREELDAQQARVGAARAAAGLESLAVEEDVPVTAQVVSSAAATEAFRAAQAEQANRIMAALAAKPRTCPSCQALLAADAARCHCGYSIAEERRNPERQHDAEPFGASRSTR